jgi:thioredoxin reductase (NADPH)
LSRYYDIIIIGGGPAGLTASVYCSRAGLTTLLLEKRRLGGRALNAQILENYPGFPEGISGQELMARFIQQARKFGTELKEGEAAVSVMLQEEEKMLLTRTEMYTSPAVIIATGVDRKKLVIPGEDKFRGRGVSTCAICDGPLFKNREVAVIGGKEAVEDALNLVSMCKKVLFIPVEEDLMLQALRAEGIEVLHDIQVKSIEGDSIVKALKVAEVTTGRELTIPLDGVFIDLGATLDVMKDAGVELSEKGFIDVDKEKRTNIEGVFAAGECTGTGMQIITSAGDGAAAGITATKYVRAKKRSPKA